MSQAPPARLSRPPRTGGGAPCARAALPPRPLPVPGLQPRDLPGAADSRADAAIRPRSPPSMEPVQQWGEEVEDGAIYSVTLQRVRAEPAANGGPCPRGGVGAPCPFVQYRTWKLRRLRAGTLPQLVRGLVSANAESDPGYLPSFLATYRAFATPARVLELLLPLGPERAVRRVLELWLRDHPEDFREPPQHPSLRQLHTYLRQAAPGSGVCAQAEGLLRSLGEEPGDEQAEPAGCESPGASPLALGGEGGPEDCGEPPDLLSFTVEQVAEQLTLMDIELFVRVRPFHCLGCVWSQRDRRTGEGAAPSVRATVAQFNAVTGCVVASVLADVQLRAPQRARLLEKWVAIAQHCYFLRNFSSLRAVISALRSGPVHRLKRTWAAIGRDTLGVFRKLSQVSDDKNHLSGREPLLQVPGVGRSCGALCPRGRGGCRAPGGRRLEGGGAGRGTGGHWGVSGSRGQEAPGGRGVPGGTVPPSGGFCSVYRRLPSILSAGPCWARPSAKDDAAPGVPDGAPSPRGPRKAAQKPSPPEEPAAPPPGTVPYLGTFLTDLVMLDTALPDFLEGGLINFEKRRKEAEILLRIRQLQASCGGYALRPNPPLQSAVHRHARLPEEQSYRISRLIEPPADSCPSSPRVKRSLSKRVSSLLLGAEVLPPRLSPATGSISPPGIGSSCEADEGPSAPCSPEMGGALCKSLLELPISTCPPEEPPSPLARRPVSPLYNQQGADSRVVRISLDNAHGNLYKSILLTSQDKTPAVVLRALQKHSLEGAPPGAFQLLQLLGGGRELLIPDGANAFYAMNPAANFDFVLRRKGPPSPAHKAPAPLPPRAPFSPSTPQPSHAPHGPASPHCQPPHPSTSPRQPPPASPP